MLAAKPAGLAAAVTAKELHRSITKLSKATAIDAALIAAWAKAARATFALGEREQRSCVGALAELIRTVPGTAAERAPFGSLIVEFFLDANVRTVVAATTLFDYFLPAEIDALLAPHGSKLLDAVEHGAAFIADVKRNDLGVRRAVDHAIGTLLLVADRIGVSEGERARATEQR